MDTAPRGRIYFPELDGLRFVAFLFVFIHHAFPESIFPADASGPLYLALLLCRSGGLGVDLFFCLSGFLITTLLLAEREREGRISIWRFWVRRALRIWPLYFAFVALCNLAPAAWNWGLGHHTLPYALFVGNWACCWLGYPSSPAALLWSVSIEEQFYVVWPPLLAWVRRRALPALALVMVGVAITVRLLIAQADSGHPMTWCNTFARLDALAVGVAIACWPAAITRAWSMSIRMLVFAAGLCMWIVGSHLWDVRAQPTAASAVLSYPLFASGAGCMLISALAPSDGASLPLVRGRAIVFLGRISYGLYVFHVLSLTVAAEFMAWAVGRYDRFLLVGIGFVVTIGLATVSYFLLERPFLALKERVTLVPSRPGG